MITDMFYLNKINFGWNCFSDRTFKRLLDFERREEVICSTIIYFPFFFWDTYFGARKATSM